MNVALLFLIEWVISFFVLWGLNILSNFLFRKKFNAITSVIFTFIVVTIFAYVVTPFVITFAWPAIIYLPIVLFFLIMNLIKVSKKS